MLLVWAGAAQAAAPEILYGPTPSWVVPVQAATLSDEMLEESGGSIFLLIDTQVFSDETTERLYYRKVIKTTNSTGVSEVSDVDITIDPAFQTLRIHQLKIIRDGKVIEQTKQAEIDMARLERDLDRRIYNGQWTALVRLADVRPGDIVDVAWSWEGRNPVFGANDFGTYALAWGVPVQKRHLRVNWPSKMVQRWQAKNSPVEPKITTADQRTVFTFGPYTSPAIVSETGTPGWIEQFPKFQISSFANWGDVARWAVPFYQNSLPPTVAAEVDRIRLAHQQPMAQLLAALQFAQEDIRYLSISVGTGGYIPRDPAHTLEKRFGDCKDKTTLFVAMVQALGFEAVPALANLSTGQGLAEQIPSPGAFDHVITRVMVDGKPYWFDATATGQRGPLEQFSQADYGYALPLETTAAQLSPLQDHPNDQVSEKITEIIDISKGPDNPLTLSSISEFRGARADQIRNQLAQTGRKAMQKSYLKFYAGYFPGIRYETPVIIEDDQSNNIIRFTEKLIADTPYSFDKEVGYYTFDYTLHSMPNLIKTNATRARKTPLAISSGVNVSHKITVLLSDKGKNWELENEHRVLDNPAFKFNWTAKKTKNKWVMQAALHSKTRLTPANTAEQVMEDHKKMRDDISWGLRFTKP
ncbi:hypothetical protein MNBD_ALPHA06-947 [hydrothermal vent metagenome]|uniref:DUF3857 domain-containing protein n=1 Tax=hydrothermal vent metagenome TaxID=652676 RepID=A0A3B0SD38_9ZZZZ